MLQILLDRLSGDADKVLSRRRGVLGGLKFFENTTLEDRGCIPGIPEIGQPRGRMPFTGLMEHVTVCASCGFVVRLRGLSTLHGLSDVICTFVPRAL